MGKAVLILLLSLGACTTQRLGDSKGPVFVLNPGLWTPTPADLTEAAP